jgi:hypothetical protein
MSEAICSTFGVTFLVSPLGEGERIACRAVGRRGDRRREVRGSRMFVRTTGRPRDEIGRTAWEEENNLGRPMRKKRGRGGSPNRPRAIGVNRPYPRAFRGERRPFSVQRVCVLPRTPLKKWNQLLLR